jgi:hypothetical protein
MRHAAILLAFSLCLIRAVSAQTAPSPQPVEQLLRFDYRLTELEWIGGRWQLRAGSIWLKDFGRREKDARQALRLIRELRLTQYGTVGKPQAVMEYWLADSRAPQSLPTGLHTTTFDPQALRVEYIQEQWCLRDATHVLFSFGAHAEEAQRALAIIRHYGFNQLGSIGQPMPALVVFAAGAGELTAGPVPSPGSLTVTDHEASKALAAQEMPKLPHLDPNKPAPGPASVPANNQANSANAISLEDIVPLDWRDVRIQRDGNEWKLMHGNYLLANFGPHESDARQALDVVRYYRFTEHCLLGRPTPSFCYFLVNGQAPHGIRFGANGNSFRPNMLRVQHYGKQFYLAEGNRVLLSFGERGEDAQQALKIIQEHHFDCLCRIGPPGTAAFTYLVQTR